MESVAAERLNKIGKNPSIVSNRAELEEDINTVNELIMQTTPIASSGSEMSLAERAEKAIDQTNQELETQSQDGHSLHGVGDQTVEDDSPAQPVMRKSKSDCYVGGTKEDRESLV